MKRPARLRVRLFAGRQQPVSFTAAQFLYRLTRIEPRATSAHLDHGRNRHREVDPCWTCNCRTAEVGVAGKQVPINVMERTVPTQAGIVTGLILLT